LSSSSEKKSEENPGELSRPVNIRSLSPERL